MFYQLQPAVEDQYGVPSPVNEHFDYTEVRYYQKHITHHSFFENTSPLMFELMVHRDGKPILRDYHSWGVGRPVGFHIICSPFFKSVLEQMHLPPHRFYPAQIEAAGRFHPYFVLHFLHNWLDDVNFQETVFVESPVLRVSPVYRTYPEGTIRNAEEYTAKNKELIRQRRRLHAVRLVLQPGFNYDVFGLRGQVIISQRAKDAFTQARITGLALPPLSETDMFSYLEIVRGGEVEVV